MCCHCCVGKWCIHVSFVSLIRALTFVSIIEKKCKINTIWSEIDLYQTIYYCVNIQASYNNRVNFTRLLSFLSYHFIIIIYFYIDRQISDIMFHSFFSLCKIELSSFSSPFSFKPLQISHLNSHLWLMHVPRKYCV